MVVYDQELCSKSSITADTASRKDLTLQGCTKVSTRTYTLVVRSGRYKITKHTPNGMSTGFRTRRFPYPKQAHGGHPTKLPVTKSADLRDGPRVCDDGYKRLGTRKCDWACRYCENVARGSETVQALHAQ